MKKEVTAVFRLTEKEVRKALYEFYVEKLKSNNINAHFSQDSIEIQTNEDYVEVTLTIKEQKDLD